MLLPFRSSHLKVFYKKTVLKNISKCTGKHLCGVSFVKKVSLAYIFESTPYILLGIFGFLC